MRHSTIFFLSLLCVYSTAHAAVPNDFDSDGVSDLTRVEEQSDKSLTWKAVSSSTGNPIELGSIGKSGDLPAMAQWLSTGTQIGVASLDDAAGTIKWSILDGSSNAVERVFGKRGDLIVSGADFNGNGTADAAVVRLVNGVAQWEIAYDMFAVTSPETATFEFGKAGDRAFYARVDGGTLDWIGMMRKGRGSRSTAVMRNPATGEVRQFKRMPKLASTGVRPRAFPIRQSAGGDLIGFQYAKGGGTVIVAYTFGGAKVSSDSMAGSGSSVVGDFNNGDGFEVAYQSVPESVVINPIQGEVREISNAGGIPVDEINITALGAAAVAPTPTDGASGGGSSTPVGGGSLAQCTQTMGLPGGYVYKTVGSHHFTDVRRNTIGVVIKPGGRGPFPGCVNVIDTSGNVVAKLALYAKGAGWAARYYAGVGCATSTPLNGAAVAAKARAKTGSSKVYLNFGGNCYGPIEASKCIGSAHC
jgi:hypothetical protein